MKQLPELWEHQKKAVAFSRQSKHLALFYDMGTGKTPTAINILRYDFEDYNRIRRTIIFGPIIILDQFRREFSKFSRIDPSDVVVLKGAGKKKVETMKKLQGKNKIVILNYEALLNSDLMKELIEWQPECLICDEAHMIKNPKAKRSKRVAVLSKMCDRRVIMTGTPVANSVEDLFMQFLVLDGGETFGDNFYVFQNRYMVDANAAWAGRQKHFRKMVTNEKKYGELHQKVMRKSLVAKKEDCIDLPKFVRQEILVPMTPQQAKSYKQMENEFITFLDEKSTEESPAVVAQLAITKSMKLLQIASGFAIDEDGNIQTLKKNPKIEELRNILTQIHHNHKAIVWAHFRYSHREIKELCDSMGIKSETINGGVSTKEKNRILNDFRDDPELRVVIASQGAGGTGTNMQAASYAIYFSRDYSLIKDKQSNDRFFRGGSVDLHDKVTRIDLMTEGTLDQLVSQALADKQDISKKVMEYKQLIKEMKDEN